MSDIRNNVILIGFLGSDPEYHETATGKKVAKVSIATQCSYKTKDGELVKDTQWHRLVAWERGADYMRNYLRKGSHVAVLGKLKYSRYESDDGTMRYYTDVIVQEFKNFSQSGTDEALPF